MTHHRYHSQGRNSWTAPTGYQHHSRRGGAFPNERSTLSTLWRERNSTGSFLGFLVLAPVLYAVVVFGAAMVGVN